MQSKPIRVWNLFYPFKAKYIRTYNTHIIPILFNPETKLEVFNNIKVEEIKQFYLKSERIELDLGCQLSHIDIQF